jgi:isopentenyl phosphate kinase
LINGFHPERLLDIIYDREYIGTCIRTVSGS